MFIIGPVMLISGLRRPRRESIRRVAVDHHTFRRTVIQIPSHGAMHLERFEQRHAAMLPQHSMFRQSIRLPPIDDFRGQFAHQQLRTRRDRPSQRAMPGERNHQHIMWRHMIYQLLHNPRACLPAEVRLFPRCCLLNHTCSVAATRVTVKPSPSHRLNTPPPCKFCQKKIAPVGRYPRFLSLRILTPYPKFDEFPGKFTPNGRRSVAVAWVVVAVAGCRSVSRHRNLGMSHPLCDRSHDRNRHMS